MNQDETEVKRLLEILRTFMRMLAVSNREVERRLGLNHGGISRVFSGQIEAKLELVLGAARAIGLEYEEFFALAYPPQPSPKPESQAAGKIRRMLEDLRPGGVPLRPPGAAPAAAPPARAEIAQDVKQAVREILAELRAGGGSKGGAGDL